ncbi:hypothetical protein N8D74_03575 [Curtobacterium flaccumfaciens]|uniref:Uncharacterized protein n=1 Tax=Curtobacterium poinsettiae TaxID=159612 RepID=A0A9Q9T2V3_9MICO|nr:hypothetical protein [Curtobacterium flaccumfaciens]UXN25973.1 hypothetical protein N8D74_03575 [Curtobacterium flaccumfaciens]UYC80814.1 hypothetical protein OE229_17160 [Curtobacterium flaccumfaciens pv. poinsettiae]
MSEFIRYQSAVPNRRGRFPGVFALANGLRRGGQLTEAETRWLREANARATAMYTDPTTVQPDCYDEIRNPGARAWFAADAVELLEMVSPYLELLDRHEIPWMQLVTRSPGRIVYRDAVQAVAVPHTRAVDWPFRPSR